MDKDLSKYVKSKLYFGLVCHISSEVFSAAGRPNYKFIRGGKKLLLRF